MHGSLSVAIGVVSIHEFGAAVVRSEAEQSGCGSGNVRTITIGAVLARRLPAIGQSTPNLDRRYWSSTSA